MESASADRRRSGRHKLPPALFLELIAEDGKRLAEPGPDTHDFLAKALDAAANDPRTRLLKYVDPYGDTYFNGLQMPDFLADWRRAQALAQSDLERAYANSVIAVAERCREETGSQLRCVGD